MKFTLGEYVFEAEKCVERILINPVLPENFDNTDNNLRPETHEKWWYRPYIVVGSIDDLDRFHANRTDDYADESRRIWAENRKKWLEQHPTGQQFIVRCLDGGAWDRSTNHGTYGDFELAMFRANQLDHAYNKET